MLQLISAGTYILNEKAFKQNVETRSLEERSPGVKIAVTEQAKWVFIFMAERFFSLIYT